MLLPQQVAVWRRDTFWQREPKSQNNLPRRTEPRPSGSLFWLTIRRPLLRCGPLGPCCLRRRLQLRGRAGGALNFFSKLCFQSCFWTLSSCTHSVWLRTPLLCSKTDWRESAPSKLLSKSSSMCGDPPESSRTRGQRARNFFKISALPNSSANRGQIRRTTGEITTCPVAATQQTGVKRSLYLSVPLGTWAPVAASQQTRLPLDNSLHGRYGPECGFLANECLDRDETELIHVKETSQIH